MTGCGTNWWRRSAALWPPRPTPASCSARTPSTVRSWKRTSCCATTWRRSSRADPGASGRRPCPIRRRRSLSKRRAPTRRRASRTIPTRRTTRTARLVEVVGFGHFCPNFFNNFNIYQSCKSIRFFIKNKIMTFGNQNKK
uniref:(northern house mosquito) hypothetical protein n=1 Tax=Culex pipiens TaxID=7175 RepID=A0A8D8IF50_CULPI